jgi:hypothetical protein
MKKDFRDRTINNSYSSQKKAKKPKNGGIMGVFKDIFERSLLQPSIYGVLHRFFPAIAYGYCAVLTSFLVPELLRVVNILPKI